MGVTLKDAVDFLKDLREHPNWINMKSANDYLDCAITELEKVEQKNGGRKFNKADIDEAVKLLVHMGEYPEEYSTGMYKIEDISRNSATQIKNKVERITSKYDRFCDLRYDSKTHTAWFDPTAS